MPVFTAETPRKDITVAERTFTIPLPYVEGHALTSGEASHMNQLLVENVRNNVAGKLKVKEGEAPVQFSQDDFDKYVTEYEFGVRKAGGGSEAKLSPLEREARRIARETLDAALKAQDKTIDRKSEDGKAKYEELISQLAAKPKIVAEAQKRINSLSKISVEELGLDLGTGQVTEETQAA